MAQENQTEIPVTDQVVNGFPKEIQAGSKLVPVKTELEAKIWDALKECYDPEIPVNIVDLGLVYHIAVDESVPEEVNVFVRMTLTAPGCGMAPMIAADVRRKVMLVHTVKNAHIDLVFEPPWTPALMSEAARLMLNM
ncbi:MAG: iron-sulfur cluster assembly protein [Bacteroidota bacterium]